MKNSFLLLLSFSLALILSSCGSDTDDSQIADYKDVLQNISNDVILPTYEDLYDKTQLLVNTLTILEQNVSQVNLDASKQAWRDARVPWEQSEGFLFGPVDQQGLDPAIDSWPVNETDLDAVLNSNAVLTKDYVDGLDGTLKGFHTLEYLIFGKEGNKSIASFTQREFEYLRACSQSLHGATKALYFAWKPDQQNFIANVLRAGEPGNSVYPSQKSALQEIVTGMITIADEVANGKINEPFTTQNLTYEESRFSANSKKDFADNIQSIENAFLGVYKNASGLGISKIIKEKNELLDAKFRQQLDDAIRAIESIQGTFTTAVTNARPSIEFAQLKVRTVQQTLESEILPLISNL
ncbi:MAG: imelysin [Saprospiraceae bacterium]|nr:imelysin [Candidatus Vicinibacter affinis]